MAHIQLMTFKGKDLEDVYTQASVALEASVSQLDIEIVQAPSKGIFGLFAKDAIITASVKQSSKPNKQSKQNNNTANNTSAKSSNKNDNKNDKSTNIDKSLQSKLEELKQQTTQSKPKTQTIKAKQVVKEEIFENFYNSEDEEEALPEAPKIKLSNKEIETQIKEKVNELFSHLCYKLDEVEVKVINDDTVNIEFNGEDSALLIGKEGYRYKALSYILFNWIHEKYKIMVRLEVAKFLITQEEAVCNYLESIIQTIKEEGFAKTKPLDGVLVHIALKKLREEFPNKYVAVKTNAKGDRKYILVNEYRK